MRYDKEKTILHEVAVAYKGCVIDYNKLVLKDDDSIKDLPDVFTNVEVIDLDCVEIQLARSEKRDQQSTVDSTFAISDNDKTEMLLVEFRFNYKNMANLERQKLIDKVDGSIRILGQSLNINNTYIYIFQPNLVQQAINRLRRMNPKIPNSHIAMDLDELKRRYF